MSELNDKLLEIKRQKDTYILPENLKKDVTAFGVTGALESGAKIFDTIEHMQQDETAQNGDLAIVYREEIQPITAESEFDSCIFPNTVVLDTAFSDSIHGRFRAVDGGWFDGNVDMSSSRFRFNGYGDEEVRITYTSSDGITYTRTDSGEEKVEFGTIIKWGNYGSWNDVIGNFMKIGGNYFGGVYEYGEYVSGYAIKGYKDIVIENNTLVGTEFVLDLSPYLDKIYEIIPSTVTYTYIGILKYNSHIYAIIPTYPNSSIRAYLVDNTLKINSLNGANNTDNIILHCIDDGNDTTLNIDTSKYKQYNSDKTYMSESFDKIDFLANIIIQNHQIVDSIGGQGMTSMVYLSSFVNGTNNETIISSVGGISPVYSYKYLPLETQLDATSNYVYEKTFYGKNGVEVGTLTTSVSNSFADINAEVYTKIQQQYENMQPRVLTDQDKTIDKNIYFIPTNKNGDSLIDTSNVTNMLNMFYDCKNLKTIPLIDTSNVTDMDQAFYNCKSLETIPLIDTSNVTNMRSVFSGCESLTSIPLLDTSSMNNAYSMFMRCKSLTTIPLLDFSNVTSTGGGTESLNNLFYECSSLSSLPLLDFSNAKYVKTAFYKCTALTTVPQFNLQSAVDISGMFSSCTALITVPSMNTSSVTDMDGIFTGCTSLENIGIYDTTKVTGYGLLDIVSNCPNLSNTSLNNILQMCTNATQISSYVKTLKNIGLSQEQATICTTLSNWSACQNAGWTTGY